MRKLKTTKSFERDLKKSKKRGKDLDKLWAIVELLLAGKSLPAKHRPHKLSGDWAPFMECHMEPDWLLIWHISDDKLILVRMEGRDAG